MSRRVLVIGAGIVGTYSALHIHDLLPSARITIVDRDPYSYRGASCGNMGGFATCEVQPMATLRNVVRGMGWMWQPLAPFTLRPAYLRSLSPWLAGFLRAALTPWHTRHVISAQQALMSEAEKAHRQALQGSGLESLISSDGAMVVYKNKRRMNADWDSRWQLFRDRGEPCQKLTHSELRQRVPELSPEIRHAVYVPSIRHWSSPTQLLRGLHNLVQARGVTLRQTELVHILRDEQRAVAVQMQDGREETFDDMVVAAGAWSKSLCAQLGDRVPLDSERGYATTMPDLGSTLRNLFLFPDDEFVATPMREGLRLGGTVELASIDAPADFRRTRVLRDQLQDYFPDFQSNQFDDWIGHRPSSPDGLPIIGRSPSCSNVFYAFGHGHVGVTQSAITGKLVSQLVANCPLSINLSPFSIQRFQ